MPRQRESWRCGVKAFLVRLGQAQLPHQCVVLENVAGVVHR